MKPTKKPAGLDGAARALKALIGRQGFVRRDLKKRALFVSDYPLRQAPDASSATTGRLEAAGWRVGQSDGLALLDWPLSGYKAFIQALPGHEKPRHGLAAIYRRHPLSWTPEHLPLAREALLLWDAGRPDELAALAGAALAQSLRLKAPVPACCHPLLDDLAATPGP